VGVVLFALLAVLLGVCPEASKALADEQGPSFLLIAHPDNPTSRAPRQFLSNLFLKEVTRWDDGETARPADQKPGSPIRRRFSESVLNRSVSAVKSYWQQRIFSGRGVPPPELDSDQAVVTYVTTHRGGIGYVAPGTELGKARLIRVE
jgi:ABC-type phosphate transport system substrate-binding protein